jgi:hypothetical protein
MFRKIRNDYDDIHSWYTDAIVSQIYPLVESGEFGSPEYLAGLLEGDGIFHQPGVFVSISITSFHSISFIHLA